MALEFLGPDAIALLGFLVPLTSSLNTKMPATLQMAQDRFQEALEALSSEELDQKMLQEAAEMSQSPHDSGDLVFNSWGTQSMILGSD